MAGHRPWNELRDKVIPPDTACDVPPPGWSCTREKGHDGPCAAIPAADHSEHALSFDAYQEQASGFAVYPGQGSLLGLAYASLGLCGESGETAEQVKKTWRDDGIEDPETFELSPERREKIVKELGDAMWYMAQVATEIGVSLGDVAATNMTKLAARRAANLIHGEGSDR